MSVFTQMHGHLLGLPVRAVRLRRFFRTRSLDSVQRLLQYILLERLRSEEQHSLNVFLTFSKVKAD